VHFSHDEFSRFDCHPDGRKRPHKGRYPVAEYIYRRIRSTNLTSVTRSVSCSIMAVASVLTWCRNLTIRRWPRLGQA